MLCHLDFFCIEFSCTEQPRKIQDILSYTSLLCVRSSNSCNHYETLWLEANGNHNPEGKPIHHGTNILLHDCYTVCIMESQDHDSLIINTCRPLKVYRGYLMTRDGSLTKHLSLTPLQKKKSVIASY